jgi:ABC-type phosphate transport system substrate-binding protein
MKIKGYLLIAALLMVPMARQLSAQTLQANIAGASALWLEAGQGAYATLGCAWTDSNTSANTYTTDVRTGAGSAQDFGKIWVVWNAAGGTCASPGVSSTIYAYISLDSGIGNRCLFAVPQCTLGTNDAALTPGSNALPGVTDTALPAGILSAFNGASINVAATDLLPLDDLFATYQALAPCGNLSAGTQYQGYGRGGWPGPGTKILAQDGSAVFNVIGWAITGNDPLSGLATAGGYQVTPVGAAPILIFVNTGSATGFGNGNVSNVTRSTLGLYFSNILVRTQDAQTNQGFAGLTNSNYSGITAWHRESLSGTYNVFDRAINNNKELYRTQEYVCPPIEPLSYSRTIADGGTTTTSNNYRALGTSDEISQVQSTNDSIGYAFWSAANFKKATYGLGNSGTLIYLTVDGVDPLCTAYGCGGSPGEIPTSSNGYLSNVNLNNVANGSYAIWSELRFITTNSGAALTAAQNLSTWAQNKSTTPGGANPDFITAPNLNVIHAHFALPFVNDAYPVSEGPRVCGASSGAVESGADSGGIVTSIQAGADFAILKSNYGTSSCNGITNAASFGTHQ